MASIKSWFKPENRGGELAREFNTWLVDRDQGWLAGYDQANVVVFDFYDILTDAGANGYSAYPTRDGRDSHPSGEGNAQAARAFVPFLNEAVTRMGMTTP